MVGALWGLCWLPDTTNPQAVGAWGCWTRTLACRVSVMAAARWLRRALAGGHLQQVRREIAQRAALSVGSLLQAIKQCPVDRDGHALGFALQQMCSWLRGCSRTIGRSIEGVHHSVYAGWSPGSAVDAARPHTADPTRRHGRQLQHR